jgi:hypothetical protein
MPAGETCTARLKRPVRNCWRLDLGKSMRRKPRTP